MIDVSSVKWRLLIEGMSIILYFVDVLGELDYLPEVAFYMMGAIEDVVAKADRLAEEL